MHALIAAIYCILAPQIPIMWLGWVFQRTEEKHQLSNTNGRRLHTIGKIPVKSCYSLKWRLREIKGIQIGQNFSERDLQSPLANLLWSRALRHLRRTSGSKSRHFNQCATSNSTGVLVCNFMCVTSEMNGAAPLSATSPQRCTGDTAIQFLSFQTNNLG